MNVTNLLECLTKEKRQELGIPLVLASFSETLNELAKWAMTGNPIEGRQLWFGIGNARELHSTFPAEVRNRVMPIDIKKIEAVMKRGPYDALLLPIHGFTYSDPNLYLSPFWRTRGSYQLCQEFQSDELHLWFWKSNRKPLKLFGMDHHHAVQWDARQILRCLNVKLDFVWLCDGRPSVNEALPCQIPSFRNSLDIYKKPVDMPLTEECKASIESEHYDGILTSHSLVTCHRLKELGLPMIHINSTRFGNDWIQDSKKHEALVKSIKELLQTNRLHIIHNNKGDLNYFHQYVPNLHPSQEIVLPSLCESVLRLRVDVPKPLKLLIWDTRQVLLQPNGSPFMKQLVSKSKETLGDAIESQAVLMAQTKQYLPEGYLDNYAAVIHIPYNVSTMSMFQQVRANIPIWVPSKRLLAELWADPKEPNELSWCMFAPGSEKNASALDNARDPGVIQQWIECADFYNKDILPLALQFDSIDELLEKALTTDYQNLIQQAEEQQETRRENIVFGWEQVLQSLSAEA